MTGLGVGKHKRCEMECAAAVLEPNIKVLTSLEVAINSAILVTLTGASLLCASPWNLETWGRMCQTMSFRSHTDAPIPADGSICVERRLHCDTIKDRSINSRPTRVLHGILYTMQSNPYTNSSFFIPNSLVLQQTLGM